MTDFTKVEPRDETEASRYVSTTIDGLIIARIPRARDLTRRLRSGSVSGAGGWIIEWHDSYIDVAFTKEKALERARRVGPCSDCGRTSHREYTGRCESCHWKHHALENAYERGANAAAHAATQFDYVATLTDEILVVHHSKAPAIEAKKLAKKIAGVEW